MSSDTDLILEMLRRQQEGLDKLERTVSEGHARSAESRSKLYESVGDVASRISKIEVDIAILGSVDGQVREEVKDLTATVEAFKKDTAPAVSDWKRMKAIGLGLAGLLALGGISIGAAAMWAGEALVNAVRHWLKIG